MNHKIKGGYNIPLLGAAEEIIVNAPQAKIFAVHPQRFRDVKTKLLVKEGDSVKIGSTLFVDKKNPAALFVSPANGIIKTIHFGPRRIVESILIEESGDEKVSHKSFTKSEIAGLDRKELAKHLIEGGMWPFIRQRPFDCIAKSDQVPSSIFVNCMDTTPLAVNPEFLYKESLADFELAIEAMQVLSGTVVHIVHQNDKSLFAGVKGAKVQHHAFRGKHPAGLVSTHIEKIDPIIGIQKKVWHVNLEAACKIGRFLTTGTYPVEKLVAVVGEGAAENKIYKTRQGAQVQSYCQQKPGENRLISGDVLSGRKVSGEDTISIYDNKVTVIPESHEEHFIGWMLPGFSKPSWSRAFFSALTPGRRLKHNTSQRGEQRSLVKTGDYRRVIGLDIYPAELAKAILSEDIELMEKLGILEIAPEDVALCTYICPSKTEFTEIIQSGLDLMQAEIG